MPVLLTGPFAVMTGPKTWCFSELRRWKSQHLFPPQSIPEIAVIAECLLCAKNNFECFTLNP